MRHARAQRITRLAVADHQAAAVALAHGEFAADVEADLGHARAEPAAAQRHDARASSSAMLRVNVAVGLMRHLVHGVAVAPRAAGPRTLGSRVNAATARPDAAMAQTITAPEGRSHSAEANSPRA